LNILISQTQEIQGRHFSFFQGGGHILTYLLGGGAKYEKKQNFVSKNTKKSLYFQLGGANLLPPCPPINDLPEKSHNVIKSN